jgi:hypothetical protein
MSGFGGKADVRRKAPKSLLLAKSEHRLELAEPLLPVSALRIELVSAFQVLALQRFWISRSCCSNRSVRESPGRGETSQEIAPWT